VAGARATFEGEQEALSQPTYCDSVSAPATLPRSRHLPVAVTDGSRTENQQNRGAAGEQTGYFDDELLKPGSNDGLGKPTFIAFRELMSARGNALLQLLMPVEDNVNLGNGGRS
jgi:hypothetical protein